MFVRLLVYYNVCWFVTMFVGLLRLLHLLVTNIVTMFVC